MADKAEKLKDKGTTKAQGGEGSDRSVDADAAETGNQVILRRIHILLYLMAQKRPTATKQITNFVSSKIDSKVHQPNALVRAVQRDLKAVLEMEFDQGKIKVEKEGQTNLFSWDFSESFRDLLTLNRETAFMLALADKTNRHLLPSSFNDKMRAFNERVQATLRSVSSDKGPYSQRLIERFESFPRGFRLIPMPINGAIWSKTLEAVEGSFETEIHYKAAWKDTTEEKVYHVRPLGVIERGGYFYLVAHVDKNGVHETRSFNLVRISKIRVNLDKPFPYPKDFDLKRQMLSKPHSKAPVRFRVRFLRNAAAHLLEARISEDQQIENTTDTHFEIVFSAIDQDELRWWLMGFGDGCEVLEPIDVRNYLKERLEKALLQYTQPQSILPVSA